MVSVIAFISLMVGAGWLLRRLGLVRPEAARDLHLIVFYLTLPPLIFRALHEGDIAWSMLAMPGLAWAGTFVGLALGWLGARLLGLSGGVKGAFILALTFGNVTYVGYPVISGLYGDHHLTLAIFYDLLGATVAVNTLGVAVAAAFGTSGESGITFGRILRRLASFPAIWALVLGLALRPFEFPALANDLMDQLGDLTVPLMMLGIGFSLELRHLGAFGKPVAVLTVGRLVVLPALTWLAAVLLDLPLDYTQAAVLEAGMPTMLYALTLAMLFRLEERLVVNAIVVTIVLSFATLPLWFRLLGGA